MALMTACNFGPEFMAQPLSNSCGDHLARALPIQANCPDGSARAGALSSLAHRVDDQLVSVLRAQRLHIRRRQHVVDGRESAKRVVTHGFIRLDQHSQVAFAPRHADAIEILAQRHRVLARRAEQVADLRDRQPRARRRAVSATTRRISASTSLCR